jgi:hypothetical protein
MSAEAAFGLIGGIVTIFVGNGLESFVCWFAAIISGFFLLTHVCNLTQSLEAKFPALAKVHLGYLVVWTGLCVIDVVVNLVLGYRNIRKIIFISIWNLKNNQLKSKLVINIVSMLINICRFSFVVIFVVIMLLAFVLDGFFKYRNWKSSSAADAVAASPASVESGGFGDSGGLPKY